MADRPARHARQLPCSVIAVLGIDGSGKSVVSRTLAERLSAAARTCHVGDGLEVYDRGRRQDVPPLYTERFREALGRFAKTARSLHRYKIPKLTELLLRSRVMAQAACRYAPDVLVADGYPLLNLAAWAALYRGDSLDEATLTKVIAVLTGSSDIPRTDAVFQRIPELAALKRLGLTRLRLPDGVVLLDVDPAVALARIQSRGQRPQVHETAERLATLRCAYLKVCDIVDAAFGIPTLVADGGQPLEVVHTAVWSFVAEHVPKTRHHE